jgi:hypothetical protein
MESFPSDCRLRVGSSSNEKASSASPFLYDIPVQQQHNAAGYSKQQGRDSPNLDMNPSYPAMFFETFANFSFMYSWCTAWHDFHASIIIW